MEEAFMGQIRRGPIRPIVAAMIACVGCGGGGGGAGGPAPRDQSSSTAQAQVKGKVTLKGKPLAHAEVKFNPVNPYRPTAPQATAKVNPDGTYEITTLIGENAVTLSGAGIAKVPQAQYYSKVCDVAEEANTFDIEIP
jgi:hypothetical protein